MSKVKTNVSTQWPSSAGEKKTHIENLVIVYKIHTKKKLKLKGAQND